MDRWHEPAMPAPSGGTRGAPAPYTPGALRALKRGWAVTRWIGLVVVIGLAAAAMIAVGVFFMITLLDSSV